MSVFVDTSAFYSLLDGTERNHATARQIFSKLLSNNERLTTTNYVLVESAALVHNRLGVDASADFHHKLAPLTKVIWIDDEVHRVGTSAFLAARRRQLSFVDCISFEVCRRFHIPTVFAFDRHFVEQGFTLAYR